MLDQLTNSGVTVLADTLAADTATIIVVGAPRSGTSMVAAALSALGIFMGDRIDTSVFEDLRLTDALENAPEELPAVVGDYDRKQSVWGFKRPMAFRSIEPHLHLFRNPRLIVPFRDPVAVAKREEVSMGFDFVNHLRLASEMNVELASFALRQSIPVMVCSYEKALFSPMAFVSHLAHFCGRAVTDDLLRLASSVISNGPENYLKSSQIRFKKDEL